jgi:peptidoglycan hydrolase CwlO-like protein
MTKQMTKEKLNWKERKMLFLEERLDEVEKELHSLPHKIYDLEHRRKSILKRMEELTDETVEEKEVATRVSYIKQRNGL